MYPDRTRVRSVERSRSSIVGSSRSCSGLRARLFDQWLSDSSLPARRLLTRAVWFHVPSKRHLDSCCSVGRCPQGATGERATRAGRSSAPISVNRTVQACSLLQQGRLATASARKQATGRLAAATKRVMPYRSSQGMLKENCIHDSPPIMANDVLLGAMPFARSCPGCT
jgi:hypothetical protein